MGCIWLLNLFILVHCKILSLLWGCFQLFALSLFWFYFCVIVSSLCDGRKLNPDVKWKINYKNLIPNEKGFNLGFIFEYLANLRGRPALHFTIGVSIQMFFILLFLFFCAFLFNNNEISSNPCQVIC